MSTSVRVEHLVRRFDDFIAVNDISFDIQAGEIWGFLGPNGSGKSTTMRMLCGVLEPSSGQAEVLGYDVARYPEAVKQRIGYMTQGASLWADLSVIEHLRFFAGLFDLQGQARDVAVETWLERVGLRERRRDLAASLPGGFRKRLALACALLHQPKMLFLDEPTAGVDPISRREFWDLIVGLADEGTTIMVTTHYLDEAEHCNQLAFIYGGHIVSQGSPRELKLRPGSGLTVELMVSENVALLDVLETLTFVRSASLFGSSLHVTVGDQADLDRFGQFLRERGVIVGDLIPVLPSLEDVFAGIVHVQASGEVREA
jgi:ABC-2 type transport system ATP-binding protein